MKIINKICCGFVLCGIILNIFGSQKSMALDSVEETGQQIIVFEAMDETEVIPKLSDVTDNDKTDLEDDIDVMQIQSESENEFESESESDAAALEYESELESRDEDETDDSIQTESVHDEEEQSLSPEEEQKIRDRIDATNPERYVRIKASWEGSELAYGDEVTLTAVLLGYDGLEYSIFWEVNKSGIWEDYNEADSAACTFILTEENISWEWRAGVEIFTENIEE